MKRVLITGGAGFIGSHLAARLLARGTDVDVLDDLSTGREENLAELAAGSAPGSLRLHRGSVTDEALVETLASGVDAIFHLAAAVGVRLVFDRPVETMETNVRGVQVVLRAAARHAVPVFFTSSSEVYAKNVRLPFHEDDPLLLGATRERRWSYACSKAMGEWLALAHARSHGLAVWVVRLFNVVGPRQRARYGMVLPNFARQAVAGEPITVFGDGRQTRAFLHVEDAVDACLRLFANPDAAGRVVNVGSTEEVPIGELARRVQRAAASRSPIVHMPYREAYGVGFEDPRRRLPDVERLEALTGFRPRRSLQAIVDQAVRHARRGGRPSSARTDPEGSAR